MESKVGWRLSLVARKEEGTVMGIRRVVTEVRDGKAVIASDTVVDAGEVAAVPGFAAAILWGTQATPPSAGGGSALPTVLPPRGGSRFTIVSFPPDAVFTAPDFDGPAAAAGRAARLRDMATTFERDAPGMHRTDTLDYAIVLSGSPVLELDDGATTALVSGDTVVQQGTRHAWRNPGDVPATIAFMMLGDDGAPLA